MDYIVGALVFAIVSAVIYALVNEAEPPRYIITEDREGVFTVRIRNPEFGNYRPLCDQPSKEDAESFIARMETENNG